MKGVEQKFIQSKRRQERRKIEETQVGYIEIINWEMKLQVNVKIDVKGLEKMKD